MEEISRDSLSSVAVTFTKWLAGILCRHRKMVLLQKKNIKEGTVSKVNVSIISEKVEVYNMLFL